MLYLEQEILLRNESRDVSENEPVLFSASLGQDTILDARKVHKAS